LLESRLGSVYGSRIKAMQKSKKVISSGLHASQRINDAATLERMEITTSGMCLKGANA